MDIDARFASFYAQLEERYLKELTFQEVRRALTALSTVYVQSRERLGRGAALDGAGKRAAFALFYGALHFRTTYEVVRALGADVPRGDILDLGCGTGVCGGAWALASNGTVKVRGIDQNAWAVSEARWTLNTLGVAGEARTGDLATAKLEASAILLGWSVNELPSEAQTTLLNKLLATHEKGTAVLVVEPIAKRDRPWLSVWETAFARRGGRIDEWRFRAPLPERLRLLDKAAGLRHDELLARSLYLK